MRSIVDAFLLLSFCIMAAGAALAFSVTRGAERKAAKGRACWYGEGYRGKRMANGQTFDPDAMTCAAWIWPLGSLLRVSLPKSGQYVIVEVTDRGPAPWTGCVIDLSARAFRRLAPQVWGHLTVQIDVLRTGPEVAP